MYNYKILKKIDTKEWNKNLMKCEYSTFFQTTEFLIQEVSNNYPIFIYIYDEKGETKGQLGLNIIKSKKGYSSNIMNKVVQLASKLGNRGTWVSGPIIHSKKNNERKEILITILKALETVIKENNLMILDGYSPPQDLLLNKNYKMEFKKNGFVIEDFLTFVIDLNQDIDKLWKNVKKNARNDVTKAQRENIEIKEIQNKHDLEKFELLSKQWAKTKGIEIKNPLVNLKNDWRDLQNNIQKFFLALKDDEILAALRIACFNQIVYTRQVLNSYSKLGNHTGSILTWSAMKWAKDSGMKIYDFSGGEAHKKSKQDSKRYSEQWNSLLSYKRKWGGQEFPYYHFIKVTNKKSYKLFRILSKPDWVYRNYKRKHFKRSTKNVEKTDN